MGKKNRGYVSPEMDVILLERVDVACSDRWCVVQPDGTPVSDFPFGCWEDVCAGDWGGD